MAAGAPRDQALSLLAAANNHGDLAVKLSSLKRAKDILFSIDPSSAADLFPYLVELQSSPETLVRKLLLDLVEEIGLKAMEHSSVLMPVLLTLLKDDDSIVAKQSIVSGSNIFCSVLEEMALQFHRHGKVERWLEELWSWMAKFKDAVFATALEPGSAGTKLLALKFLETYVLLFTSDKSETETVVAEESDCLDANMGRVITGSRRTFNISLVAGGHPVLEPYTLMSEANRTLGILLSLLHSASSLPGSLTMTVVNCLASIARKRPLHYGTILSALLDFNPNFEIVRGCHAPSILYSVRSALLGFLRCTNPTIMESRERLVRALRAMNAGDAADQVIRQVDKMIKNAERALLDVQLGKDDQSSSQLPVSGDLLKKRSVPLENEDSFNRHEVVSKRLRYDSDTYSTLPVQINENGRDESSVNGLSPDLPLLDAELNPVEKMIAVIGALLAEGERGAESLEILISKIHPDLLADIVITNMKHLPRAAPPFVRFGNLPRPRQMSSLNGLGHAISASSPTNSVQSPTLPSQLPFPSASVTSSLVSDLPTPNHLTTDSKRDPRRDPRRLDPRRVVVPSEFASTPTLEDADVMHSEFDSSISLSKSNSLPVGITVENPSAPFISREEEMQSPSVSRIGQTTPEEEILEEPEDIVFPKQANTSGPSDSPVNKKDDSASVDFADVLAKDEADTSSFPEFYQHSPVLLNTSASEDACHDLPLLPVYVDLTQDQQQSMRILAVKRIIDSYKHLYAAECSQMRLALLARLVAQIDADDQVVVMLEKHVIVDYQEQKGHELVLHVLYHLYSLTVPDSVENTSFPAVAYEKFLLAVATALLGSFPSSDKSFSKLLGEAPILPDSALKLLGNLCYADVSDQHGKDIRDVERITQGLGAVWSLILGRPNYRQACLDIALKCAVHLQDEIRAKAIRLVTNKLYQLSYISENIEQFAKQMLLSAVDNNASDLQHLQAVSSEQRAEGVVGSQETSVSDSQVSDTGNSDSDSIRNRPVAQSTSTMSFLEAQRLISLFFALCSKKPDLLRLVFNIYGRAPKTVKQAFHRHIPILIRALGSSYTELLNIVSDPPEGSENLLVLVLQILTQETTPPSDLIATVKHLYETKLKDVSILIPVLPSLSKNEVLPIFPRLVALPLEKFQRALAHILQGSAHTGPALTPAEVLVAIHGIVPEKDGLPLKKITDACSACFEQRTVFTQQVLAKALTKMVDQTPLPLLFMRTVIQSIDAFPSLVDFVMEILSKLVSKQVWKMPKLWVGFLKCVSQTQPHSFHVLLQLPPPQLESALNKHANLRSLLAAFASQPNLKSSLPRSTLAVLGLANEMHVQQPHRTSSFNSSDAGSLVHGTTITR